MLHNIFFSYVFALKFTGNTAFTHDIDTVRKIDHFDHLGGDQ